MFPILLEIGPITIYSYGFFIALGYLATLYTSIYMGKRDGISAAHITDLCFYLLLIGFVGSRILFVITRLSYYIEHPIEVFYVWEGGLVFFGGLILSTAFCYWYVKKHSLPVLKILDIAGVTLPLAHAFGRIGCFSAGCCHGRACDLPWAVKMHSAHVQEDLRGAPIHPTQLYEAILLFLFCAFAYYKWKHKRFDGQIVLLYFMTYPIFRSFVEIYRGDSIRGFVIPNIVSTSQFISAIVFVIAAGVYLKIRPKAR